MTIEVSICNKDDHGILRITLIHSDPMRSHPLETDAGVLRPHETKRWHVHKQCEIKISEDKP